MFQESQSFFSQYGGYVLTLLGGGAGLKIAEMFLTRFFGRKREAGEIFNLNAQGQATKQAAELSTLQVTDKQLREWLGTATKATKELMDCQRKLNSAQFLIDDVIDLLLNCVTQMKAAKLDVRAIEADLEKLVAARRLFEQELHNTQEQTIHVTKDAPSS